MSEPEEWTPEGLVDHFWRIDRKMHDRRFCFILGAGASVQSGIPAAGALVRRWLGELHQRLDRRRQSLEQWATESALGIPGFALDRAAAFYSQVFERRFRQSPDEGYADLEDIMQGKDPSFGYSVLAHILAETRHKLVITTNFDNLVTDALSIFTATSPLVCGHESLAAFIRVVPRRPVVVKIHRDLLMAPMNRADEIATLQNPWIDPLTRIFAAHTPIVLGYGGNDGSLMGFLNGLPPGAIVGGLYWCYYGPGGPPGREICDLVAKHGGALVPIDGFDELMLRLTARLGIPLLDQVIETKARTRVESYRRRIDELRARSAPADADSSAPSDTSATTLPLESSVPADSPGTTLSLESPISPGTSGTTLSLDSQDSEDMSETTFPIEHASTDSIDRDRHAPLSLERGPRRDASLSARPPLERPSRRDASPSDARSSEPPTLTARTPADTHSSEPRVISPTGTRSNDAIPPPPPDTRSSDPRIIPAPPDPRSSDPRITLPPTDPRTSAPRIIPAPPDTRTSDPRIIPSPSGARSSEPAITPTRSPAPSGARSSEPAPAVPPTRSPSPAAAQLAPSPTRSPGGTPRPAPTPEEEDAPFDIDLPADDVPSTRGQTLEQVLQQVAAETAETSPLAALTQARLERRHETRLQALRAASARFPRDAAIRHALAEELSAAPATASHGEAMSILESLLAENTDDARAMRHLALLHAWNRNFRPAAGLLRRIAQSVSFVLDPVDAAHLTFIAGLLARLSERDDTRFLALLKSAVYRAAPRRGLPEGLVRHLLDRLDRPSRRTYVRLLSMFVDGAAPHRVELVEPRFAAVPPADLATLTPDDFTWPQDQPT